jgi:hypothetical protein
MTNYKVIKLYRIATHLLNNKPISMLSCDGPGAEGEFGTPALGGAN